MDENRSPMRLGDELGAFIWETVKVVVISLAIIIPVRYYLIQPFFVRGDSMKPNFQDKDYILVDKIDYRLNKPERGDVIVFRYPLDPKEYFIKRIIALPGETIGIQNNTVTIFNAQNPEGFVLDETYLPKTQETVGTMRVKLDNSEYFVMGDNRLFSSDSRRWGPLNRSYIAGRAWLRLWPLEKAQFIPDVKYTPAQG
ncbi:MAG: signal peptidase I [Candidatus Yanofskybacteria bacterium]|nr:signal peptidase I [Candidatus Yanofskybacteria bacterium]